MATLHAYILSYSSSSSSSLSSGRRFRASLQAPTNLSTPSIPPPKQPPTMVINMEREESTPTTIHTHTATRTTSDENLVSKLYAIAEAAAERAEMHAIIGVQRNNWNHLLLHSINSIILTASIAAGISSMPVVLESSPHLHVAFKLSSAILFAASASMMLVTNQIQPSQLAEEQRNATRLFRRLEKSIHTCLAVRSPTEMDVKESMERVLALDKAYPLPLLPVMLEKFPKAVEPTVWWPKFKNLGVNQVERRLHQRRRNGWSEELEEEMTGIVRMLKSRDIEQYVRFGEKVLGISKILAVSGPVLAGLAAVGAGLVGIGALGPWPAVVGVVGGALATVANTLEHGGQVGMVFELSRNCAGFYRQLEEEIKHNLGEGEVEKRENGDLFEMKVALRLGRSLSELKGFGRDGEGIGEFAGKLF